MRNSTSSPSDMRTLALMAVVRQQPQHLARRAPLGDLLGRPKRAAAPGGARRVGRSRAALLAVRVVRGGRRRGDRLELGRVVRPARQGAALDAAAELAQPPHVTRSDPQLFR